MSGSTLRSATSQPLKSGRKSRRAPDAWKKYWCDPETKLVHFIGKDNIPFHAVFFPAMIMGQKSPYKLPDEIPANEFLMLEGKQFSKSDNWTIDLEDFFSKYTPDQARYTLAANAPETSDSEFSWKDFQSRCNADLLGKLGNFVHRVLTFAKAHCDGKIPPLQSLHPMDEKFLEEIGTQMQLIEASYSGFHLRKACQQLMELAALGNGYFDAKKPWTAAKEPSQRPVLQAAIACSIRCIWNLALAASPIIPETAQEIWRLLGFQTELAKQNWQEIQAMAHPEGQAISEPKILFRKIEGKEIEAQVAKLGKKEKESALSSVKSAIEFQEIEKLDLRIAQVLEAVKIPKSKKLLQLLLDLGGEKRTVVSGIALSYDPERLIGKKVILVANLAPAKIMGIESQGMILAASSDAMLELPTIQDLPPGSVVS